MPWIAIGVLLLSAGLGFVYQTLSGFRTEATTPTAPVVETAELVSAAETAPTAELRDQMALAGSHTFASPTGERLHWKVDRLTTPEMVSFNGTVWYGANMASAAISKAETYRDEEVFTAEGATATFALDYLTGYETVYEITTTATDGTEHTFSVQVFPANRMTSFRYASPENPDVKVYITVPATVSPKTRLVSVMHGAGRNADGAMLSWNDWATRHDFIAIAPEFPYPTWPIQGYSEGNMFEEDDGGGALLPESRWSLTVADDIAQKVIAAFGLEQQEYDLFGHSSGGRFVHRTMMFKPEAPIRFGFPANPGLWTMPTFETRFPWGLQHPLFSYTEADLRDWTNRKMIIIRGLDDVVRDIGIDVTPEGDAQGKNRVERAQKAYDTAKAFNPDLAWEMIDVPACAHEEWCTAAAAQAYIETHAE